MVSSSRFRLALGLSRQSEVLNLSGKVPGKRKNSAMQLSNISPAVGLLWYILSRKVSVGFAPNPTILDLTSHLVDLDSFAELSLLARVAISLGIHFDGAADITVGMDEL